MHSIMARIGVLLSVLFLAGIAPTSSQANSFNEGPLTHPTLVGIVDGATLTSLEANLSWINPPGTTQVHIQIIPFSNDGPGVDLYFGDSVSSFAVPPPPQWYGLLPDMSYTWRVRSSAAPMAVSLDDASWTVWGEHSFRTPGVSSATISPASPTAGSTVSSRTPTLTWQDANLQVFYYELQLSKDSTFNTNPITAQAMVYSALLHGAMTSPRNSYSVPVDYPLEPNTAYYWRVRPRVQGDGTPVAWSAPTSFTMSTASAGPVLSSLAFGKELQNEAECQLIPDTRFSYGLQSLYSRFDYTGSGTISMTWRRDGQEITALSPRTLQGPKGCVWVGLSSSSGPLPPGTYKLDVISDQLVVQSGKAEIVAGQ